MSEFISSSYNKPLYTIQHIAHTVNLLLGFLECWYTDYVLLHTVQLKLFVNVGFL
jgi:hypothetical protein